MKDDALGRPFGDEDVERVGPGVARVDHQRQGPFVCELDLGRERSALDVAGRVVVVVVEPGFTHRCHPRLVEQVDDRVDAVDGIVRVQTDGGPHLGMVSGDGDRRQRGGTVTSHREHPRDPGLDGGPYGRLRPARNPFVVDVAVGVEPIRHWDQPVT